MGYRTLLPHLSGAAQIFHSFSMALGPLTSLVTVRSGRANLEINFQWALLCFSMIYLNHMDLTNATYYPFH